MNRDELPESTQIPGSTARKVADAAHFKKVAAGFTAFLEAAARSSDEDRQFHAQMLRERYDDVCQPLGVGERLTGNREPEMAEAIAFLQRLKEEYRELLD